LPAASLLKFLLLLIRRIPVEPGKYLPALHGKVKRNPWLIPSDKRCAKIIAKIFFQQILLTCMAAYISVTVIHTQ